MKHFKGLLQAIMFILLAINISSAFAGYPNYWMYKVVNNTNDEVNIYLMNGKHISTDGGNTWVDSLPMGTLMATLNPVGSSDNTKTFNFYVYSLLPRDWPSLYLKFEGPGGRIIGIYQYKGWYFDGDALHCYNNPSSDPAKDAPNQILDTLPPIFSKTYPLYYVNDCSLGKNSNNDPLMQQTITINPVTINVNITNKFTGNYSFQPVEYYPSGALMRTYSTKTDALKALTSNLNKDGVIAYGLNYFCQMVDNASPICSDEGKPGFVTYNLLDNNNRPIPGIGCEIQYYWNSSDAVCRAFVTPIKGNNNLSCKAILTQTGDPISSCTADVTFKENPPREFDYTVNYQPADGGQTTYRELKFVSKDPADNYVANRPAVGQDNVPVGNTSIPYKYCLSGISADGVTCNYNPPDGAYAKSIIPHKVIYKLDEKNNIGCEFDFSWEFKNDGTEGCIAKAIPSPNPPSITNKNVSCVATGQRINDEKGDRCVYQFTAKEIPAAATSYNLNIKNDTKTDGDGIDLMRLAVDQPKGATQNPPDKIAAGAEASYTYNFSGVTQVLKLGAAEVPNCRGDDTGVGCVSYGTADNRDACLFTYAYQDGQCVMTAKSVGSRLNCSPEKETTSPVNGVCTGKPVIKLGPASMPSKAVINVFNNTYANIVASDSAASVKGTPPPASIGPSLTKSFDYDGNLATQQKFYYSLDGKYPVKCEFTFGWDDQQKKCIASAVRVADQYPIPGKCLYKLGVAKDGENACVINFEMNSNP